MPIAARLPTLIDALTLRERPLFCLPDGLESVRATLVLKIRCPTLEETEGAIPRFVSAVVLATSLATASQRGL
jgi:hypothetical protein